EHIKGHIEFRNVSFSYDKEGNQALTNINVTINEGETIAIIGATGSGKTTLFQLVSRLFTEDEGQVFIDRKPASDYSVSSLRQAIGYVPQTPLLFSGSIRENIAWGKRDARTEDIVKAT